MLNQPPSGGLNPKNMSFIDNLKTVGGGFLKTAAGASNPWTAGGMFLGNLVTNIMADRRQARQNRTLMEQQGEVNKNLIDYKSPAYDVARLKEAGLNPALYYGGGGAGGAGISGVSQGNTANYSDVMKAKADMALTNKQLELMESEKQVNLANAEKLRSGAGKDTAETKTIEETRDAIRSKLGADAVGQKILNARGQWENAGHISDDKKINTDDPKGDIYRVNQAFGYVYEKAVNDINEGLRRIAVMDEDESLKRATTALTNEKAQIVFKELLVAIQNSDSERIRAKAEELSKNWNIGESTNWKTWVGVAKDAIDTIIGAIK